MTQIAAVPTVDPTVTLTIPDSGTIPPIIVPLCPDPVRKLIANPSELQIAVGMSTTLSKASYPTAEMLVLRPSQIDTLAGVTVILDRPETETFTVTVKFSPLELSWQITTAFPDTRTCNWAVNPVGVSVPFVGINCQYGDQELF